MIDPSDIAGDVVAAATALAGLILVYLGSLATGYGSYDTTQQHSVKEHYRRRAWLAFAGFLFAIGAAILGVLGKWTNIDTLTVGAGCLLILSFCWGIYTAYLTVQEIS